MSAKGGDVECEENSPIVRFYRNHGKVNGQKIP